MTRLDQFNNDEFNPFTFVIDPSGCGCTDCIMGYSTPKDELDIKALQLAIWMGFELVDRT